MLIKDIKNAEDLLQYLREFQLWQTNQGPYDQNLILHMLLAILDNLQSNHFSPDVENIGHLFNDSQRHFIKQISDIANSITDEEVAIIEAIEEAEESEK